MNVTWQFLTELQPLDSMQALFHCRLPVKCNQTAMACFDQRMLLTDDSSGMVGFTVSQNYARTFVEIVVYLYLFYIIMDFYLLFVYFYCLPPSLF